MIGLVIWVIVKTLLVIIVVGVTCVMFLEMNFQFQLARKPTGLPARVIEYYAHLRTTYAADWLRYRLRNSEKSDIFNKIKAWNGMWQTALGR